MSTFESADSKEKDRPLFLSFVFDATLTPLPLFYPPIAPLQELTHVKTWNKPMIQESTEQKEKHAWKTVSKDFGA